MTALGVGLVDTQSLGRGGMRPNTPIILISESGLYKLVMRSDKETARAFQDWVTRTVLVNIRATGSYVMGEEKLNDPSLSLNDLDALNDHLQAILTRKAELLEAKVIAWEAQNAALMVHQCGIRLTLAQPEAL